MGSKVLFIWEVNPELKVHLESSLKMIDLELIFPVNPKDDGEMLELAKSAEVMVGWRPKWEWLESAENLRLFINPGVGVAHHMDNFKKLRESRNVILVNGHGNDFFTAQHTVAMLLTICNKIREHHGFMKGGKWRTGDKEATTIPLRGKKVGLLGFGHVGQKVYKMLSGFEVEFHLMKRRTWSDVQKSKFPANEHYTLEDFGSFLPNTEILICTLPSTEATKGMIGGKEIAMLSEHPILINVGRGDIFVEEDFYSAIKSSRIAFAGIDVWYNYKPEEDENGRKYPYQFPFHELENVLLSPHRAASPFNDLKRWDDVLENIKRFVDGRSDYINVVDLEEGY